MYNFGQSQARLTNFSLYLLILSQADEHWDQVCFEILRLDHFGELAEFAGSCSADHGSIILAQRTEVLPQIGCGR